MLEVTGLTKRYDEIVALDGVSFAVPRGRMVGFLGPNGSGKTTTMRGVFSLLRLDGGTVTWDGSPVDRSVTRRFGYMPESRGLYPRMRILDQVTYFATLYGLSRHDANEAARHWLDRLGLSDRLDARVDDLSHGNQQRVQLAVSLAGQAELLVLDEPFSGLDPLAVTTMGDVVREQAERGAGVLFSSHQLDLVEGLCDDIVVIDHGRVVLSGALDTVRASSPYRYVEVRGGAAGGDWHRAIAGSEVIAQREGMVRLRVPSTVDAAATLSAASGHGAVEAFSFEPPSLPDLFREAVQR